MGSMVKVCPGFMTPTALFSSKKKKGRGLSAKKQSLEKEENDLMKKRLRSEERQVLGSYRLALTCIVGHVGNGMKEPRSTKGRVRHKSLD